MLTFHGPKLNGSCFFGGYLLCWRFQRETTRYKSPADILNSPVSLRHPPRKLPRTTPYRLSAPADQMSIACSWGKHTTTPPFLGFSTRSLSNALKPLSTGAPSQVLIHPFWGRASLSRRGTRPLLSLSEALAVAEVASPVGKARWAGYGGRGRVFERRAVESSAFPLTCLVEELCFLLFGPVGCFRGNRIDLTTGVF